MQLCSITHLSALFISALALVSLTNCGNKQTSKPETTVQANTPVDSTILRTFVATQHTIQYVKKEIPKASIAVFEIYLTDDVEKKTTREVSDTIGYGTIFRDSVFDCNGDQVPDLLIAGCSTTGSFGGCNCTVYTWSKTNNAIRSLSSLANKFNILFFPEEKTLTTYDFTYNYHMVKYYRWTGFDALQLFRVDSLVDPMLRGEHLPKTMYITDIRDGKSSTRKINNSPELDEKYQHYFGHWK